MNRKELREEADAAERQGAKKKAAPAKTTAGSTARKSRTKVPKEVIICPLMLKKHMVSTIVGFSFKTPISDEEAEFLVRIMRKASVAFEILVMKSRIVML